MLSSSSAASARSRSRIGSDRIRYNSQRCDEMRSTTATPCIYPFMRMDAIKTAVALETPRPNLTFVTAPTPMTVLYDGGCRFCTRSAQAIQHAFGRNRVILRDFQQPGSLDPYPTVTPAAATTKMHVVMPDGRVFAGAEAFARIVVRVPILGWVGWFYYVPGLRQLADLFYALIAKYRYRLGRAVACDSGTCRLHGV